ncbi:F-box protein CPR1-like [Nicotiana tomentosiformis]|uniref:F-box protein CPR1-like n=1 Tax=Nicotiana tomentosiformis TaxID=4098 RepID=UPI00051B191C|nr:F-box protein CPR1-like [Nicotiana tomentosiformis]
MVNGSIMKLPEDLVFYILLRCPVKSLMRFKGISKAWYNFIQSATFINLHLNRITTIEDEFILFKYSIKEEPEEFKNVLSFLSGHNDALNPLFPDIDVSYMTSNCSCTFFPLIGPCNGLIALTDSITIILINPATRNFRLLPPSPFGCPKGFHRSVEELGLGFDSIANDYKVVRLSEVFWDPPNDYPGPKESKVDMCDLSIDSWRELDYEQLPLIYWVPCAETFYKEAVHWFATIDLSMVILCFDVCTETFRNMKMPHTFIFDNEQYCGLVILSESLTLICYPNPISIDQIQELTHIWVMKEYGVSESWILKDTIRPPPIESPLDVWKNNLLLFQSKSGLLISYNLNSDEVKELKLNGFPGSLSVKVYKESLTSIPRGLKL